MRTFADDVLDHIEHVNNLAAIIRKREDDIVRLKKENRTLIVAIEQAVTLLIDSHNITHDLEVRDERS